jgi:glycopeptide antibiotics resistance protein
MLRQMLWAMWDDARRGENRAPTAAPGRPPVLRRRTLHVLAVLAIGGIVYGTLAPFRMDPGASWRWNPAWSPIVPADALCNVMIYVPVGALVRLVVRRRGSRWLSEWTAALAVCVGLSYLAECTQTILAGRVATWTDVVFNSIGATIGIALGPIVQRLLRNQHAWFFDELRQRPFAAAAAAGVLLILLLTLMPPDLQTSPAGIVAAIQAFGRSFSADMWITSEPDAAVKAFDAVGIACLYGVVCFLLVLAAIETGMSITAAAAYAIGRIVLLATGVELLQIFTISHCADAWDLLLAVMSSVAWASAACGLYRLRRHTLPDPSGVLRWLAITGVVGLFLRASLLMHGTNESSEAAWWLPMAAGMHRPWMALLDTYLVLFTQYAAISGCVIVWCRSAGVMGGGALALGATVWLVFLKFSIAVLMARGFDTMEFALAVVAASLAVACVRALAPTRSRRLDKRFTPEN